MRISLMMIFSLCMPYCSAMMQVTLKNLLLSHYKNSLSSTKNIQQISRFTFSTFAKKPEEELLRVIKSTGNLTAQLEFIKNLEKTLSRLVDSASYSNAIQFYDTHKILHRATLLWLKEIQDNEKR